MTDQQKVWDPLNLPDSAGRTFIVTGANAGIGYFISEQLASSGATVVLASRNEAKARRAMEAIHGRHPTSRLQYIPLDISRLDSAKDAGAGLAALNRIDGIILNAASLRQKDRQTLPDGHELVFGTNYYGNVQFVNAALPHLARTAGARVITMGSIAQRIGRIDLDDLEQTEQPYRPWRTYGTSKLAQMLFAVELERRLRAAGRNTISLIAHPGGALDGLTPDRPPAFEHTTSQRRSARVRRLYVQGKDRAAWPAIRAALDPAARGGQIWGPGSPTGSRPPRLQRFSGALTDPDLARELWQRTKSQLQLDWDL